MPTSVLYTWASREVASFSGRGAIYIWAQAHLVLKTNTKDAKEDSLRMRVLCNV